MPRQISDSEALLEAKWRLVDAICKAASKSALAECSAGAFDRPIADTPWLADQRYGNDKYDARWYAVMGAKDRFYSAVPGAIDEALRAYAAAAYMEGYEAARGEGSNQ